MTDDRHCTCPPMERPHPCAKKFALSECKAATMLDPVCYRWRHQKDEVWKYGRQPAHLVPPRGKLLIGYYIVQPLYSADAVAALQAEIERLRADLGDVSEKLMISGTDLAGARAEIERLRAEINSAKPDPCKDGSCDCCWVDKPSEIERLRVDAERYRFVRTADKVGISAEAARDPVLYDAAIDAAIAKGSERE